jgi:hypothetical protein
MHCSQFKSNNSVKKFHWKFKTISIPLWLLFKCKFSFKYWKTIKMVRGISEDPLSPNWPINSSKGVIDQTLGIWNHNRVRIQSGASYTIPPHIGCNSVAFLQVFYQYSLRPTKGTYMYCCCWYLDDDNTYKQALITHYYQVGAWCTIASTCRNQFFHRFGYDTVAMLRLYIQHNNRSTMRFH